MRVRTDRLVSTRARRLLPGLVRACSRRAARLGALPAAPIRAVSTV